MGGMSEKDVYTGLSGLLMLYSILRYLESGSSKYLFLLSGALIIHFADKETSFIYALQAFAFLAIYFIIQITKKPWESNPGLFRAMIIGLVAASLFNWHRRGSELYKPDFSNPKWDRNSCSSRAF